MATEIASDLEQHVAASINAERAAAGLAELKLEVHLNASAQAHSAWMSETGTFSHTGEDGSTATDRIGDAGFPLTGSWQTAENLAYVSIAGGLDAGELDTMHEGLMDSEGHRANILDPNAAYVGVGLSVGEISVAGIDQPVVYLTEHFADTDGEVLVQDAIDGETVLQPHQDGEPTGDPEPAVTSSHDGAGEGTNDPEEDEEQEPETTSAGGCFVATAAYGSWSHPDVAALRRFRDEVLVRHRTGRAFIRIYRVVGPRLARLVSPLGASGRAARAVISPLARLARNRTGARQ
jgi:hypothetical protein